MFIKILDIFVRFVIIEFSNGHNLAFLTSILGLPVRKRRRIARSSDLDGSRGLEKPNKVQQIAKAQRN